MAFLSSRQVKPRCSFLHFGEILCLFGSFFNYSCCFITNIICCAPSQGVLECHWSCCKDAHAADLRCLIFFLVYIPLLATGPCICNRTLGIKTEIKQRRQGRGFSSLMHNSFILYSCLHLSYLKIRMINVLPPGIP